jgi:hypothetical protein
MIPESVFTIPESTFTIAGIAVQDPGIGVHDRPEPVFTMLRNTHSRDLVSEQVPA